MGNCNCSQDTSTDIKLHAFDPKRKDEFITLSKSNTLATGYGHAILNLPISLGPDASFTFKIDKSKSMNIEIGLIECELISD